ncbi:hypothetical protein THPR109532_20300 [Thalassospira profundimaris]
MRLIKCFKKGHIWNWCAVPDDHFYFNARVFNLPRFGDAHYG